MEKNTVCLDLYQYNDMFSTLRNMQEDINKLRDIKIELQDKVSKYKKALVLMAIDQFNISHYRYEQVVDLDFVMTSGVGSKRKELNDLGITDTYIISVITDVKAKYESENKKGE